MSVQAPVTVEGLLADREVKNVVGLRRSRDGFDGDGALGDLWLLDAEKSIVMGFGEIVFCEFEVAL